MSQDRDQFVRASLPLLQSNRNAPGYPQLSKLLARSDWLLTQLCDPDCFSKQASIELATQMVQFEPMLDTKLIRQLPDRESTGRQSGEFRDRRAGPGSARSRFHLCPDRPTLTHLLRDPNPRQAKAALPIGRRVKNSRLVESCLQAGSTCAVRANAMESLWGADRYLLCQRPLGRPRRIQTTGLREMPCWVFISCMILDIIVPYILAMAFDARPLVSRYRCLDEGQTSDPALLFRPWRY